MSVPVSPFPVHTICLFLRVSSWSSRWTTHSRDVTSNANPVSLGTSRERWDLYFLEKKYIYIFFQLDHLLTSFSDLWEFGQRWWGLYDKVEEMAIEGEL